MKSSLRQELERALKNGSSIGRDVDSVLTVIEVHLPKGIEALRGCKSGAETFNHATTYRGAIEDVKKLLQEARIL